MFHRTAAITTAVLCAILALGSAIPASADGVCVPKGVDLSKPMVDANFSSAELGAYAKGLQLPEMTGLRATINAYIAGHADRWSSRELASIPKDVLRRPMSVQSDYPFRGMDGAYQLAMFFKGHHDKMISLWVYKQPEFWQVVKLVVTPCSEAEQTYILRRYAAFDAVGGA